MKNAKAPQKSRELTPLEVLGLRVSAMIQSPRAQSEREVTIFRLDSDPDEAWDGVMELLAENDDIEMTHNDDGTVTLRWELQDEQDPQASREDIDVLEDEVSAF